jgi:Flp pilus assembly protein TadD
LDYEVIIDEYTLKLEGNPDDEESMCRLAVALIETGENERALDLLKKAVDTDSNAKTLTNLGCFLMRIGEPASDRWFYCPEKAAVLLEQAVRLNPPEHYPYSALGEAYLKLGTDGLAVSVLDKATTLKGTVSNYNNYGVALYKNGCFEDAAKSFYTAHTLNKNDEHSYYPLLNYAFCLVKLGQQNEAAQIAGQLAGLLENNFVGEVDSLDISSLFYLCCKYDEVIRVISKAYDFFVIRPLDFSIYLYSLYQEGRLDEFNQLYEKAVAGFKDRIDDINNDPLIDSRERESELLHIREEMDQYENCYRDVVNGTSPTMDYNPYVETDCYFYGCQRHNNSY